MIDACDNCGAKLTEPPVAAVEGGFDQVCPYCGSRNHRAAAKVPRLPPSTSTTREPRNRAPAQTSKAGLILALIGVLIGIGAMVFAFTRGSARGSASVASSDDDASWDEVGGVPDIATIGGSEAAVGRLRDIGKSDQLFVGAFDSTSLKKRWKVGPFGTYTQGYHATHFQVVGAHVVVTDFHAVAHVYDLQTGKEERSATLTDKVEHVCPVPPNQLWIEQVDKRSVLLDLSTATATEAPAPPSCASRVPLPVMPVMPLMRNAPGAPTERELPKIPGFESERKLEDASAIVLFGKKSPGTATPMVVGLDKQTYAVRWQMPLPSADLATVRDEAFSGPKNCTLHGDRFVGSYGVGDKSWHVTAIDTTSGARQWDTVLKPIFAVDSLGGIVSSDTRVYVVRMESVDVLDAATGKAIGAIGSETYESDVK